MVFICFASYCTEKCLDIAVHDVVELLQCHRSFRKIKTEQSLVIKIGKRQGDESGQNKVLEGLEVVARNIKRLKPSMGQIGLDYIFELTSEARFTY